MHVVYHIVDPMLSAKLAFIRRNVFVYLDILETLELHVINVSEILQLVSSLDISFRYKNFNLKMHDIFSVVGLPTEPVLAIGCYDNDECPLYNACENTKCINPCAERNPCAPSAICKVINHEPECTCPDGFIGSPLTDCRPRKLPSLCYYGTG